MNSAVVSASVAAVVSIVVTLITLRSNSKLKRSELLQTQYKEVIQKRMEVYPKLWRIHIRYETNWVFEKKPKTREWAQEYLAALNEFNLEGGIFFSDAVYKLFGELRIELAAVIDHVAPGDLIPVARASALRRIFYGDLRGAGLSTYLEDDLGSYQSTTLQLRRS